MARIPTGDFGNVTAQAPRPADRSGVFQAIERLGQVAMNIAADQQAREVAGEHAKANTQVTSQRIDIDQVPDDIAARIDRGELRYENAHAYFDEKMSGLKGPDRTGLSRDTVQEMEDALGITKKRARIRVDEIVAHAHGRDSGVQLVQTGNNVLTLADAPNANLPELLTTATIAAQTARLAGAGQDMTEATLGKVRLGLGIAAARQDPDRALALLKTNVGTALAPKSGDPIIDALDYAGRLKVQEAAQSRLVEQSVQTVVTAFADSGTSAGIQAMAAVEKSGLPPELMDDFRAHVNEQIGQLRNQRRGENVDALTQIEMRIAGNSAGRETRQSVDHLLQVGALSSMEAANYQGQITRAQAERTKDDGALAAIATQLQAGLPADPGNAEQMRGLDTAFKHDTTGAQPGDPAFQAMAGAYAGKLRVLPPSADSWLGAAARSPTAAIVGNAAAFYARLQDQAPEAAARVDSDTKAMLGLMSSMMKSGTSPQSAFETARSTVFETRKDVLELRKNQLGTKDIRKENDTSFIEHVNRDFHKMFSHAPPVPDALRADFDGGVAAYYGKTGDLPLSRKLAWADIRKVWGRTEINGRPEIMAYAPEAFHPGMTPEIVRADLREKLEPLRIDGGKVQLVPSTETAYSNGMRWHLGKVNKYGAMELVRGADGQPLRYALPTDRAALDGAKIRATRDKAEQQRKEYAVLEDMAAAGDERAGDMLMVIPRPAEGIKPNGGANAAP